MDFADFESKEHWKEGEGKWVVTKAQNGTKRSTWLFSGSFCKNFDLVLEIPKSRF